MRLTLWMTAVVLIAPLALSAFSAAIAHGRIAQPDVASDTAARAPGQAPSDDLVVEIEGVPWHENPTAWLVAGAVILLVALVIGWAATRRDVPRRDMPGRDVRGTS
jgi:hypothetical protein